MARCDMAARRRRGAWREWFVGRVRLLLDWGYWGFGGVRERVLRTWV